VWVGRWMLGWRCCMVCARAVVKLVDRTGVLEDFPHRQTTSQPASFVEVGSSYLRLLDWKEYIMDRLQTEPGKKKIASI
jgi:hypothetical protein